ncbi:MAG: AraC family transcriptional regulator [Gammaproteobacteria bacterium]|nr:AraC family transcriptional regulator [Gammaproteobacteria bacterium]
MIWIVARLELSECSAALIQMNHDPRLLPLPPPPPWADRYRSDDLDEVREWVARSVGEHSRVAHGAGPLGFDLASVSGTTMTLGWGRVGLEKTLRARSPGVLLHLPTAPGSTYRFGRSEQRPRADDALIVAPGQEFTRRSPPGSTVALQIDAQGLTAEIVARVAADGSESLLRSGVITLGATGRAELLAALGRFVQASARGNDSGLLLHSEAHVVAVVARLLLRHDAVIRARPVTGRRIGDLEDWIESHLEEPMTLGRLCSVAGVGERALSKIFESRRGMSPMRYVTERRLAAARSRLLRASAADEVTEIATDLGFTHLGRFAIAYREVFGESPSQTLRRGRRVRYGGSTAQP